MCTGLDKGKMRFALKAIKWSILGLVQNGEKKSKIFNEWGSEQCQESVYFKVLTSLQCGKLLSTYPLGSVAPWPCGRKVLFSENTLIMGFQGFLGVAATLPLQ